MILYTNDDDVFLLSIVLLCFACSSALCTYVCVCVCVQVSSETRNTLTKNRADVNFLAACSFWRRCFAVSYATLARTASETRTL
jgi:hypothetical protein